MKRLVVLISNVGTGSNLLAIINAIKSKEIDMTISAVICDRKDAPGLVHAKTNSIKVVICEKKEYLGKILDAIEPDFIALAGWKQIVPDEVVKNYHNRILNVHPGLIPDKLTGSVLNPDKTKAIWNRGLLANKAIKNFIDKKASYAGSTVHFLTDEFDFGPVLGRAFEKIKKNDTVDSLYLRLKKKEHKIYIDALAKLAKLKRVLIVDGGGRGSALAERYSLSSKIHQVYAIPGNDFMRYEQKVKSFPNIKTTDVKEIINIVKSENVDFVDVAQDDAVAAGLTDALKKHGVVAFGPTKKAGQIEWDKAWSRNFMKKFNLPHPSYKICETEKDGINFVANQQDSKWFIKAAGLAAGKGAIFAKNNLEAEKAIVQMKDFGKAGDTYLIEECLEGEEFSAFAAVNGNKYKIIGYAQDHKRALDGDNGPNTGGMGCSTPPKIISEIIEKQINDIFKKTTEALVSINRPYIGILYLGGIVDFNNNVKIIEFNARWGDPEAQVILPSIKNDYFEFISKILEGQFPKIEIDKKYRIVVSATSKGYPNNYSKVTGKKIEGFEGLLKNYKVYGAGIKKENGSWVASGGRLFYVVGEGPDVAQARKIAYNALSKISIGHGELHYRKDIGYRDLVRFKRR